MSCVFLEDYVNFISAGPIIRVRCGLGQFASLTSLCFRAHLRPTAPIRVNVATVEGLNHSIPVSSATTVGQLIDRVPGYEGGRCTLSYNGKVLSGNRPQLSSDPLSRNNPFMSRNPFISRIGDRSQQATLGGMLYLI